MKCKASRCTGQRIQTASVPDTMLTTGITALFSLTCALAVANVYSAQPLLDSMAVSLKVSPGMIGSVITATQAGYAIGLLFLVPLGDSGSQSAGRNIYRAWHILYGKYDAANIAAFP